MNYALLTQFDHAQTCLESPNFIDTQEYLKPICKLAASQPQAFIDQLDWQISDDLDQLFSQDYSVNLASYFQTDVWLENWNKTRDIKSTELKIVTAHIANNCIIAIPLCLHNGPLVSKLTFAAQDVSDYNHPFLHEHLAKHTTNDFMCALWVYIMKLFPEVDCLDLRKLLHGPMSEEISAQYPQYQIKCETENSKIAHLSGDWAEDLNHYLGSSSKRSLKRKSKLLSKMGEVTYREANCAQERQTLFHILAKWKTLQLSDLGFANRFEDKHFITFLDQTALNDKSGLVRLFSLQLNGKPVAITYMLCLQDRWFLYQTAYTNTEPSKHSPGYLLLMHIMECASNEGAKIFDFGYGNEAYKNRFADENLILHRLFLANSPKGRLVKLIFELQINLRALIKSNKLMYKFVTAGLRFIHKTRP